MAPAVDPALQVGPPLYTAQEHGRTDTPAGTLAQGILTPIQVLAGLVNLRPVERYPLTGQRTDAANISPALKTLTPVRKMPPTVRDLPPGFGWVERIQVAPCR